MSRTERGRDPLASSGPPHPVGLGRTIALHRAPGRGGGRPEEALRGLALPVAELRLEALVLLEELVDPALLRQAALAEGAPHGASRSSASATRGGAGVVHSRCWTSRQR